MRLKKERTLLIIISSIISLAVLYLFIDLASSDFLISVIPGWHTTILTGKLLLILTILIGGIFIGIFYLIFKIVYFLLSKIILKEKN